MSSTNVLGTTTSSTSQSLEERVEVEQQQQQQQHEVNVEIWYFDECKKLVVNNALNGLLPFTTLRLKVKLSVT
jgi:hypothetical protein